MAGKQEEKWRGRVKDVIAAPIDKVWPILADFDGLHKNFPQIFSACETVEGEKNKVGSLRALVAQSPDGFKVEATERLVSIDDVNYTTTYTIEKINLGWTGYDGKIVAKSVENGQTLVVWTFEVNPTSNQTEEEFLPSQQGLFQAIINGTKGLVAE